MEVRQRYLICCAVASACCAASHVVQAQTVTEIPGRFIYVKGTQFFEGNKPFYFVGANLNVMHESQARARAGHTIVQAAADGLKVGRVWALGEGMPDDPAWKKRDYLFRAGPEQWQENAFLHLDRVIAEAQKAGMRLVVTLSNRWADYGGIPMYLRWAGHVDVETYGYADRFFTDAQCKTWFKQHLDRIVGRVNSITGVAYRDDPTIFSWELQNEMNGTPEAAGARRQWVVEMSRHIRKLDPNHLIVPGVLGYNLQAERREWLAMNQLPEVSYCDQHSYPEEHLRSKSLKNMRLHVDDRVQLSHYVVKKPIVFGEFGFDGERQSVKKKAYFHEQFLRRIFFDGGNGAMVWIYQPQLPWGRKYGINVDEPHHATVRTALRKMALFAARQKILNRNAKLGEATGTKPIAPVHVTMKGPGGVHRLWRSAETKQLRLLIPVDTYSTAYFEEAGQWGGGILVHAYGRQTGYFDYQLRAPTGSEQRRVGGQTLREVVLRVRLSAEFPGRFGPEHARSVVNVRLGQAVIGTLNVATDDGVGRWYELRSSAQAVLSQLRHAKKLLNLRFEVADQPDANGVAIYGSETPLNREPLDEPPGPIELTINYY